MRADASVRRDRGVIRFDLSRARATLWDWRADRKFMKASMSDDLIQFAAGGQLGPGRDPEAEAIAASTILVAHLQAAARGVRGAVATGALAYDERNALSLSLASILGVIDRHKAAEVPAPRLRIDGDVPL
jgi:hypothetical protein